MRVWLGDEEITHMVTGVSIETDTTGQDIGSMYTRTVPTNRHLRLELAPNVDTYSNSVGDVEMLRVTPPASGPTSRWIQEALDLGVESRRVTTRTPRPGDTTRHTFVQDPEEEPARLCRECGMWPDHHNHYGGRCVCQECMDEGMFREASDVCSDSYHYRAPRE
jgi:hypothetical protein